MTTENTIIPRDAQLCENGNGINGFSNLPEELLPTTEESNHPIEAGQSLACRQSQCHGTPLIHASSSTTKSQQAGSTRSITASATHSVASQQVGGDSSKAGRDGSQDMEEQISGRSLDINKAITSTAPRRQVKAPGNNRKPASGRNRNNDRATNSSKTRRKIPQEMQGQWRVGVAPSVALALSREEAQIAKVISQAQAFYVSMFEVFWGPLLRSNQFVFDLDNRIELFRDSSVTATCLVAADKSQSAQEVLNRVLSVMDNVLRDQHPQLYLILAELCLGLVKTPNNALRDQIARYLASRAQAVLGAEHPITILLTLQLCPKRKESLGHRLWETILPILLRTFGPDHYQCSTQVFCQARNLAACGRHEEAVESIEKLIDRWSQLYGANSLIVCYSKIELANILMSAGSVMKAEFVVSDALRSSDMIQAAELRNEECNASEKRHRASSIAFPKVAGFRTLGKLHRLRGNLGAARYHYSQAVAIGAAALGEQNPAVELAQNELNIICELEIKQTLERFSLADISKLTDIVGSPVMY